MGFWGTLLLVRTDGSVLDLKSVVNRSEGLIQESRIGLWVVGQFQDPDLYNESDEVLPELAAETGAPCLVGFVLDSDAIALSAFSSGSGQWFSALAPESMRRYCEDYEEDYDTSFLAPADAAKQAVAWGREAGLKPDLEELEHVLEIEPELFAEPLFYELLHGLGISGSA